MWFLTDSKARRPTQSVYEKFESGVGKKAQTLARRVASGKDTPDQWADKFLDLLEDSHGNAAALGRQRAGVSHSRNADDNALGAVIATDEWQFLQSFRDDITDGLYTLENGTLDGKRIATRASWYVKKLLGTANEAFVQASGPRQKFEWSLNGVVEQHCDECPDLAKNGPYTKATLPTYPRAGYTSCLFHCNCSLKRSDGIAGFLPPS